MTPRPLSIAPLPVLLVFLVLLAPRSVEAEVFVAGRDAPSVQAAIARAAPGDVVEVPEGRWLEHVVLDRAITLRGTGGVLDGAGEGTVLRVEAPGAIVEGLFIRGSGDDLGAPDVCVFVAPEAEGAVIRDNRLDDCAFGIWTHSVDHVRVLDNHIVGRAGVRTSDRGNGIHLFDGTHLEVRGNFVRDCRDGIYVSATHDSVIAENTFEDQRFGIHYMYSFRNRIEGNTSRRNGGGIALMQSRELHVVGNIVEDSEEVGILFRDAQYCEIRGNILRRNGEGMFFFSSTENEIKDNRFVHNDMGMRIWAGSLRNEVSGNAFIGNRQQVFYVSSADQVWGEDGPGNFWSDYLGWDQDGDGVGDRPYRIDSFTANLLHGHPAAVLLLRSPILELLQQLERKLPLLTVPTIIDLSPMVRDPS